MEGVKHRLPANIWQKSGPREDSNLHTLKIDTEQSTLLCVTTEAYQHLIGCATWWVIGLSISEDSQFPGCLLWTIPKKMKKVTGQLYMNRLE